VPFAYREKNGVAPIRAGLEMGKMDQTSGITSWSDNVGVRVIPPRSGQCVHCVEAVCQGVGAVTVDANINMDDRDELSIMAWPTRWKGLD
jgi:hypothetical protein